MFLEALISIEIKIEIKIGDASRASVLAEAYHPAALVMSDNIRASMGSTRRNHPASPVVAAHHTILVDGAGTRLRNRRRTMKCPICRRLPLGRILLRRETLTAAMIPTIRTLMVPANHAISMSGLLPWDVQRVAVGIRDSQAVMSLAIHEDRASRHDLPARPTIIAASRE